MVKQGNGGRILGAGSIASYRTAGTYTVPYLSNSLFASHKSKRILIILLYRYVENLGPYGATKFAVRGFTEAAAKEWAEYGIRVNGAHRFAIHT